MLSSCMSSENTEEITQEQMSGHCNKTPEYIGFNKINEKVLNTFQ